VIGMHRASLDWEKISIKRKRKNFKQNKTTQNDYHWGPIDNAG